MGWQSMHGHWRVEDDARLEWSDLWPKLLVIFFIWPGPLMAFLLWSAL